jgi:hypothetical protein
MLKEAIEAARAVLARATKLREALARAESAVPTAKANAENAERAFAGAHADALVDGGELKPADLEGLQRKSERAERESRVAAQAARDLKARLRSVHGELGTARSELSAAVQRALADAFAALFADARAALAPIRSRLEGLRKASPTFGDLASWALEALLANVDQAVQPPSAPLQEPKTLHAAQDLLAQLARLEEQIREQLTEPPPPPTRSMVGVYGESA